MTRSPLATSSPRPRVLLSDDQHDILIALELLLKLRGYQTRAVDSPRELLRAAGEWPFDMILMDLNYTRDTTSGEEGLALLVELRKRFPTAPVVVMTAWSNVELAVEAMRLGASDFVQKPWDNDRLTSTLAKQLDRAAELKRTEARIQSEVEIARHVQQKLFPQKSDPLKTLEYAGRCVPAREVGGDYYDFFVGANGPFAGVLADVSGKGVAAAMLMANLQASFRGQLGLGTTAPARLLETVNRLFYESTPAAQYVTLFFFDYDETHRRLRYINCGHPAPVIVSATGAVRRLEPTSTVLGLFANWSGEPIELPFEAGDILVAFTDGMTDRLFDDGTEFGEDRLMQTILECQGFSPIDTLNRLLPPQEGALTRERFDDETVVALRGL